MWGNSHEFTLQTIKEVRKAWELFVTGAEKDRESLEKVRPEIRESWFRSKQAGVNPAMQRMPTGLTPEELHQRCQDNVHLLEAGREASRLLSQMLTADTFVAVLTDGEGYMLHSYFPPNRHDKREAINALPGTRVQESLTGTTPLATTLHLDRPFQSYWYENYAEFAHCWAGCGAPIHDACGNTRGVLVVSGYREIAHPRALDLVTSAAGFIEERIQRVEELAHLEVLKEFNRRLLKFPESPLLALCPHGRILALSPGMAKLLMIQPPERLIGRFLRDTQDFRCEGLFPLTRHNSSEPYESSLVFPYKETVYSSTVIPVRSKEGETAGMVVVGSGLKQPPRKRVERPSWRAVYTFSDLVGEAPLFRHAIKLAERAAEHSRPVLLIGESGTGKEVFAHAIHRASSRAHGPFVALNLSVIPKDLAAAELFGYEEGAFSGARKGGSRGKVELAHRGTLFLDELREMPLELQPAFLRFLEEPQVVPLGSEHPRAVDVRIIAATNVDLKTAVEQGQFRLDLYHRLNLFPIFLPPLRERREDIPALTRYLLEREGFANVEILPEVMEIFSRYDWPGNIRELQNVLIRAAMVCANQQVTRDDLPAELLIRASRSNQHEAIPRSLDRERLQQALSECGGHISRAAQRLGIHRVTLYRKLRHYGLTRTGVTKESLKEETTAA
ncbi:MAG: sigma 54-interacting transcriptional regulator [Thermodesulfobacteriota bacterium]|jgi:transcriptional regulator of acetoin/glycerol metabolism